MNRVVVNALVGGLVCASAAMPAWAQYKVVGPDGRITYTDRRPTDDRPVAPVKTPGAATPAASLPYELRTVVTRYPVTLYSSSPCSPCDMGRALLTERGVPFTEKSVNTSDDARALQARESTDQLPAIRIGGQRIAGFERSEWTSYLDAAGYPKQSVLPATYRQPPATPLAPAGASQTSGEAAPVPFTQPTPTPTDSGGASPSGIRF